MSGLVQEARTRLERERDLAIQDLQNEYQARIEALGQDQLTAKVRELVHQTFCGTVQPDLDLLGYHAVVTEFIVAKLLASDPDEGEL